MVTYRTINIEGFDVGLINITISEIIQEEKETYPKRKLLSHAFYSLGEPNYIYVSFIWSD